MTRRFLVAGRVQGVGFRMFVQTAALREGLAGHVRNLEDGRVEAVAWGPSASLERLARALRDGPPLSRVERVEVTELVSDVSGTGFHIRA